MQERKKLTKKRSLFALFIIIFIVGNVSFYLKERAKWMYEGQPYPKAKEWLIPANMMLVYGTTLTKLPFIDERSFIMKPIIGFQDYFVKKWQENLPNDDAEKYLGWYIFRFRTYLVPNAGSVILYTNDTYSYTETRKANEKAWKTIEAMSKYKAKDREFNEIRYAAFLSTAFFYVESSSIYWAKQEYYNDTISMMMRKQIVFNADAMFKDRVRMERFYRLFVYVKAINTYYKKKFPKIYKKLNNSYYKNYLNYEMSDYILRDLIHQNKKMVCQSSNRYVTLHFSSKQNLQKIYDKEAKLGKQAINKLLNHSVDDKLKTFCKGVKQ